MCVCVCVCVCVCMCVCVRERERETKSRDQPIYVSQKTLQNHQCCKSSLVTIHQSRVLIPTHKEMVVMAIVVKKKKCRSM